MSSASLSTCVRAVGHPSWRDALEWDDERNVIYNEVSASLALISKATSSFAKRSIYKRVYLPLDNPSARRLHAFLSAVTAQRHGAD